MSTSFLTMPWVEILVNLGLWIGFAAYVLWNYRGEERKIYLEKYRFVIVLVAVLSLGNLRGEVHGIKWFGLIETIYWFALIMFMLLTWPRKRGRARKDAQHLESHGLGG